MDPIDIGTRRKRRQKRPERVELELEVRYIDPSDEARMRRYDAFWNWLLKDVWDDRYAA